MKNDVIRSRYEPNIDNKININPNVKNNEKNISNISVFYKSVFKNESDFFKDFDSYLKFQIQGFNNDKGKDVGKYSDLANKFSKFLSGNSVSYFKVYSRCSLVN